MNESTENCDKKPLISLWYVHKATEQIALCDDDARPWMIRLQSHYLALARKYGVTADQLADSLEITQAHAVELLALGQEIG